ncbi:MAG: ATP-binding cassette domain-containing protein, partial [Rhodoferax sp.]|nr:ATP-binding cassette domain-containing protein [Actinomycetota bacterium]
MIPSSRRAAGPVLELRDAGLVLGGRQLWSGLDLTVEPGSFVTVIGPNGSGKSSLLNVILGMRKLTSGDVHVNGRAASRGTNQVGYVPQHRGFGADVPLRGADLVQLGVDGHRWGLPSPRRHRVVVGLLGQGVGGHPAHQPLPEGCGGGRQRGPVGPGPPG